jgi:hypothetical protein
VTPSAATSYIVVTPETIRIVLRDAGCKQHPGPRPFKYELMVPPDTGFVGPGYAQFRFGWQEALSDDDWTYTIEWASIVPKPNEIRVYLTDGVVKASLE